MQGWWDVSNLTPCALGPSVGAWLVHFFPSMRKAAFQPPAGRPMSSEQQMCVTLGWELRNGYAPYHAHPVPTMTQESQGEEAETGTTPTVPQWT